MPKKYSKSGSANKQSRKNQKYDEKWAKTLGQKSNRKVEGAASLRKKYLESAMKDRQERGDARAKQRKEILSRKRSRSAAKKRK